MANTPIITGGIDPGLSGAIVILHNGSTPLFSCVAPTIQPHTASKKVKATPDTAAMARILLPWSHRVLTGSHARAITKMENLLLRSEVGDAKLVRAMREAMHDAIACLAPSTVVSLMALEIQQSRSVESANSALQTGYGWGIWSGLLAGAQIPTIHVASSTWTRRLRIPAAPKGTTPKARKEAHVLKALELLPQLNLVPEGSSTNHDGLADAGLLALYAYREILSQNGED